ncbi:MAG: hypothetical protein AAFS11_08770, partial [Planctomycetota bacterium]
IALAAEPIEQIIAPVRCAAIIEDVATDLDEGARNNLYENVAMRLYDRCRRHEALGWAARACGDNGWRLAIYGDGWDTHPTLAAHARGRVAHGMELCSAYNAARVTLDTSTLSGFHQRIAECVLSGGIPAVLLTGLACTVARAALKKQLLDEHRTDGIPVAHQPGSLAFPAFRHPEAMRFARFGSIVNGRSYPYAICEPSAANPTPGTINTDREIDLLELGVRGARDIQRIVQNAADPVWRSDRLEYVLQSIRGRCTHAALAKTIIDHYALVAERQTVAA